jgi:hypothetical protein
MGIFDILKPKSEVNTTQVQKTTKHRQVLKHLIKYGSIDSWTAIELYGATRLSAIIFNLRKKGYEIDSIFCSALDRNSNVCNYTTYRLSLDSNYLVTKI